MPEFLQRRLNLASTESEDAIPSALRVPVATPYRSTLTNWSTILASRHTAVDCCSILSIYVDLHCEPIDRFTVVTSDIMISYIYLTYRYYVDALSIHVVQNNCIEGAPA